MYYQVKETSEIPRKMEDINSIERANTINTPTHKLIGWSMHRWCNYRCPYCFESNHCQEEVKPLDFYIQQARNITTRMSLTEKYHMVLTGGEVTFLDLKQIFEVFNDYDISYTIMTNLSNTISYYLDLIQYCSDNGKEIILNTSYHGLYHEVDKEEFKNKIIAIANRYPIVRVTFVIGPETKEAYEPVMKEFKELNDTVAGDIKIIAKPLKPKNKETIKEKQVKVEGTTKGIHTTFINDQIYNVNISDIPYYVEDFNPYGFECTARSDIIYNIDHFVEHRCGNTNPLICESNTCDLCSVKSIRRIDA